MKPLGHVPCREERGRRGHAVRPECCLEEFQMGTRGWIESRWEHRKARTDRGISIKTNDCRFRCLVHAVDEGMELGVIHDGIVAACCAWPERL